MFIFGMQHFACSDSCVPSDAAQRRPERGSQVLHFAQAFVATFVFLSPSVRRSPPCLFQFKRSDYQPFHSLCCSSSRQARDGIAPCKCTPSSSASGAQGSKSPSFGSFTIHALKLQWYDWSLRLEIIRTCMASNITGHPWGTRSFVRSSSNPAST